MLKVYSTLSDKKDALKPIKDKKINLFVCGPTVYDFSHLGHARTYIVFDMIVKYLRQSGFDVFYLQNITDIDDKIIIRAKEKNISWRSLSKKFEKEYFKDMKALGIDSVSQYSPATKHIKEIISQVRRLLKSGFAYETEDGIYYDIKKFKDYGKLSKRTALQAEDAVSRVDEAKGKKNKGDFCLWKKSKPGEPYWQSPWFLGRPGWHIEDTAITEKYFGPQYDIHGGARDLIFPHHEAEIAQMEAISQKKPLVKYWFHTGFLTVKGQKMAKSLGNFIIIRDFLKKNQSRLLRFLIIKTHYRSPIDYNEKSIEQTKEELKRIATFVTKIKRLAVSKKIDSGISKKLVLETEKEFESAMEDDFNSPEAVAAIFKLISKANVLISESQLGENSAKEILKWLEKIEEIFGVGLVKTHAKIVSGDKNKLKKLAEQREKYRKQKNWQKADEIRKKIARMGYQLEDTKEGPEIKRF